MEWTEETIARLWKLWTEGHPTAEIARCMGISKNAVVGKACRLHLPARPSLIRRKGDPNPPPARPRRATGSTLPSLAAEIRAAPVTPLAPPVLRPVERPDVAKSPHRVPPHTQTCLWPLGEPGTPSFRFCDGNTTPGKQYCAQHTAVAYVKVRNKREEAAA